MLSLIGCQGDVPHQPRGRRSGAAGGGDAAGAVSDGKEAPMRSSLSVVAVVAALFAGSVATPLSGSTGPIPLTCGRACLEGVLDQYLKALVAHDPSRLPLSKDRSEERRVGKEARDRSAAEHG